MYNTSNNKPVVKSPDYSFVNLSIQPRQTLNLIQRNLSSPSSFSMKCESINNNNNTTTTTNANNETTINNSNQQQLFNPKKYWLKCSTASTVIEQTPPPSLSVEETSPLSVTITTTNSTVDVVPASLNTPPPKKRRHILNEDHSNSSSQFSDENTNNKENDFVAVTAAAEVVQTKSLDDLNEFYQCYNQSSSSSYNMLEQYNFDETTLNPVSSFFHYQQQALLLPQLSIYPIDTVSVSQQGSPSSASSQLQVLDAASVAAAALEAQKRKRVSLAEYRQRKETTTIITTKSSEEEILNDSNDKNLELDTFNSNSNNNEILNNTNPAFTNTQNDDDLLKINQEEKLNDFEIDNISSGKSKINKLLTEIMANNKNNNNNNNNTFSFKFDSKPVFTPTKTLPITPAADEPKPISDETNSSTTNSTDQIASSFVEKTAEILSTEQNQCNDFPTIYSRCFRLCKHQCKCQLG